MSCQAISQELGGQGVTCSVFLFLLWALEPSMLGIPLNRYPISVNTTPTTLELKRQYGCQMVKVS